MGLSWSLSYDGHVCMELDGFWPGCPDGFHMSGISDGISRTLGDSLCVHGLSPLLAWASSQH